MPVPVSVPAAPARKAPSAPAPAPVVEVETAVAVAVAEPEGELPISRVEAKPAAAPVAAARRTAKPVKQEELPFDAGSRGRFENSIETIHKGENLDQPTFRRRRLAVKP